MNQRQMEVKAKGKYQHFQDILRQSWTWTEILAGLRRLPWTAVGQGNKASRAELYSVDPPVTSDAGVNRAVERDTSQQNNKQATEQ